MSLEIIDGQDDWGPCLHSLYLKNVGDILPSIAWKCMIEMATAFNSPTLAHDSWTFGMRKSIIFFLLFLSVQAVQLCFREPSDYC